MDANALDTQNNSGGGEDLTVYVNLFGGLSIKVGDVVINESSSRSYQIWNLLEYLIAFRKKNVSSEELHAALWGQDDIENPSSALKNLVYRIRSVFASHNVPFAKDIIVYSNGSYHWNNDIPCVVDIEEFEDLQKRAGNALQPLMYRIESYLAAIALYKGDFLADSKNKNWVMSVSGYYKSTYFKCVNEALKLLAEQEHYQDIERVCEMALTIDRHYEPAHKYFIMALSKSGRQSEAMTHYKFVSSLFLHELGVQPSASLRNLYRQIAKVANNIEIDIGIIQQDFREAEVADGAFYCEYEVFKSIYQVLSRTAPRIGQSVFVVLFTLTDKKGGIPDTELRKKAMDGLFRVIKDHTRRCDVFARFTSNQYVLLLPTTSLLNGELAVGRITKTYKQSYSVEGTDMHTKIQPLDPSVI